MPTGYNLNPNIQMKIEDERAGRLDYVYETLLSINECQARIGRKVTGKLSEYEVETNDGVLYILFADNTENTGGLYVAHPQKYAVRFESISDKTLIRVRYIWENDTISVQYLLRDDIDAFFETLFDASVSEAKKMIWVDSAEEFVQKDPLGIHGTKKFWIISTAFVVIWIMCILFSSVH